MKRGIKTLFILVGLIVVASFTLLSCDGTGGNNGGSESNYDGNSGNDDGSDDSTPGKPVKAVAAGGVHTIALAEDGTLWAWGDSFDGQLRNGTNTEKNTPVLINSDTDWASVFVGRDYTMAIKSDHTLWAWGRNHDGELGDGSAWRVSPVKISF